MPVALISIKSVINRPSVSARMREDGRYQITYVPHLRQCRLLRLKNKHATKKQRSSLMRSVERARHGWCFDQMGRAS